MAVSRAMLVLIFSFTLTSYATAQGPASPPSMSPKSAPHPPPMAMAPSTPPPTMSMTPSMSPTENPVAPAPLTGDGSPPSPVAPGPESPMTPSMSPSAITSPPMSSPPSGAFVHGSMGLLASALLGGVALLLFA